MSILLCTCVNRMVLLGSFFWCKYLPMYTHSTFFSLQGWLSWLWQVMPAIKPLLPILGACTKVQNPPARRILMQLPLVRAAATLNVGCCVLQGMSQPEGQDAEGGLYPALAKSFFMVPSCFHSETVIPACVDPSAELSGLFLTCRDS